MEPPPSSYGGYGGGEDGLLQAAGQTNGYTSVFQAEDYALLQCARENNLRAYRNKRINILTDSQAALKGLRNHKECWKELSDLARYNRVVLLWVPGHSGIKGNEKADELARKGSSASALRPESSPDKNGAVMGTLTAGSVVGVQSQLIIYCANVRLWIIVGRQSMGDQVCPQLNIAPIRLLDCTVWCRVAGFWTCPKLDTHHWDLGNGIR
ncbi:hypothetical protein NQ315_014043 [Exocentrus adspersus]|uniref:RNase H type-1 domain-containing protein n=1 Tax=Exocentrus adspersus TaxID=1586481 RepID=A0AAV8VVU1_9CUCU|nr:hypothetical protein NQ315_014043 [Exocentrus adspersus]